MLDPQFYHTHTSFHAYHFNGSLSR